MITLESAQERFLDIKEPSKAKIEVYAKRCYLDFMNPETIAAWENNRGNKDWERAITRPWYDLVHSCSVPTGLITKGAFDAKLNKGKSTKDHCFRPQFIYRYMLDNHRQFEDYEIFRQWFIMSCSTVWVTPKENDQLSLGGTDNRGDEYRLNSSTDQQYVFADLPLYSYSSETLWKNKTLTQESNVIDAPPELLNYEKRFMLNNK